MVLTCSDQWVIEVSDGITLTPSSGTLLPAGIDGKILIAKHPDPKKNVILRPFETVHRALLSEASTGSGHESWLIRISGGMDDVPESIPGKTGSIRLLAHDKTKHDIVAVDLLLPGETAFGAIKKVPVNPR